MKAQPDQIREQAGKKLLVSLQNTKIPLTAIVQVQRLVLEDLVRNALIVQCPIIESFHKFYAGREEDTGGGPPPPFLPLRPPFGTHWAAQDPVGSVGDKQPARRVVQGLSRVQHNFQVTLTLKSSVVGMATNFCFLN